LLLLALFSVLFATSALAVPSFPSLWPANGYGTITNTGYAYTGGKHVYTFVAKNTMPVGSLNLKGFMIYWPTAPVFMTDLPNCNEKLADGGGCSWWDFNEGQSNWLQPGQTKTVQLKFNTKQDATKFKYGIHLAFQNGCTRFAQAGPGSSSTSNTYRVLLQVDPSSCQGICITSSSAAQPISYTIWNTGTSSLKIKVTDSAAGGTWNPSSANTTGVTVASGGKLVVTHTAVITGNLTVTVQAYNPSTNALVATQTETIPVNTVSGLLSLQKYTEGGPVNSSTTTVVEAMHVVYKYAVTNPGSTTLSNIKVTDSDTSLGTGGLIGTIPTLLAGQTVTLGGSPATKKTFPNSGGPFTNFATAVGDVSGQTGCGVSANDSHSVTAVPWPIDIFGQSTCVGETAKVTFRITNVASADLTVTEIGVTSVSPLLSGGPTFPTSFSTGSILVTPGDFVDIVLESTNLPSVAGTYVIEGYAKAFLVGQPITSETATTATTTNLTVDSCGLVICETSCPTPGGGVLQSVVPNATVAVLKDIGGGNFQPTGGAVVTNAQGNYILPALTPGTYQVQVSHEDYVTATSASFTMPPGVPPLVQMTPKPVTPLINPSHDGRVFFAYSVPFITNANSLANSGGVEVVLTGPSTPQELATGTLGQLTAPPLGNGKFYRYHGYVPGHPEAGEFTATRPLYVFVERALINTTNLAGTFGLWNEGVSRSFMNTAGLSDTWMGSDTFSPGATSGVYTVRLLFGMPFQGPAGTFGTAHGYFITGLDMTDTLALATMANPTAGLEDMASYNPQLIGGRTLYTAKQVRKPTLPWRLDAGPAVPLAQNLTEIPAGWMAFTQMEFKQRSGNRFVIFAVGGYSTSCGGCFAAPGFSVCPEGETPGDGIQAASRARTTGRFSFGGGTPP